MLSYEDHFHLDNSTIGKIMSFALSKGGEYSDIYCEYTIQNQIVMEEGIISESNKWISLGVGIRTIKGEGTGYAYTEKLSFDKLKHAALTAAAIADSGKKINPVDVSKVDYKNHYPVSDSVTNIALAEKIALIKEAEEAARKYDTHILKTSVSIVDRISTIQIATSEGQLFQDVRPMLRFTVQVVAENNGNRQIGVSSGGGRKGNSYFQTVMSPSDHGHEAARQAILLLDAVQAPAGRMELVLAPAESGILLHESIGHPLEADFIRKRTSAYTDKIGEKVASELVTVIDSGIVKNDRGSINFDDEGTISSQSVLIEKGILKGYMHDRISAKFLNAKRTGNGRRQSYKYQPIPRMTTTYLVGGKHSPEEIFKSTKKGIYCKSFRGGQVDTASGDFVFVPIEAYLIEDGKITAPIKNFTLIGNGPDVLSKVTMTGNDFAFSDGRWTCGKGRTVPVNVGLPTIKVSEIIVGGSEIS
ncbi:TldD/PmbA family protein [bacterium]|nr:TldD/PmbA family protein [bacterium]